MPRYDSKYSFELWNFQGQFLLDLALYAQDRQFSIMRNGADDISFTLDLNDFEKYCLTNKVDPSNVLIVNSTEVKIKRLGTYVAAGQINYINATIQAQRQVLEIRTTGYFNLLSDRYTGVNRVFTATQATDIAWTAINESQSQAYGNFGITRGTVANVGVHDRTYNRDAVKDVVKNLSQSTIAPFDFEITPFKVFNTYSRIGADRPEIIFEYPHNITEFDVPIDGTGIANQIIALGSGYGQAQVSTTVNNTVSQSNYQLRQKIVNINDSDGTDNTLTDAANVQLDTYANPLRIPSFTINGSVAPFLTDYKIGDRVYIKINNYKFLKFINGMYRLEKITVNIDNDDNESVSLQVSI